MASLVLGARLILSVVFAAAGIAKLFDRPGARRSLTEFGVPERPLPILVVLLPLAELAAAVALVARPSARLGAVAALVLLLAFIGGIAYALSRGRAPDCHCFGQIHSSPAGRGTLMRNAALAVLALIVLLEGPGPSIDGWIAERTGAELAAVGAGVAAVLLGLLSLRLWLDKRALRGEVADLRGQLGALPPGLPVGAKAPGFTLPSLRGETLSLESLRSRGRPVALLFVDPYCGPCRRMLPDVSRWQATLADRLTIVLVTTGGQAENQAIWSEHGLVGVLVQEGSEVMDAYRVDGTPSAVIVTADGRIGSSPTPGPFTIEELIRVTLKGQTSVPLGTPAAPNGPPFEHSRAST